MPREVLGSIWKIGRYPIKVSEVLCFLMHLNGKISEKLIFFKAVEALVIILTWYV